jgi:GDPmannose 4,6-dehydratase
VTRKITRAVARIAAGIQERLYLGNMESTRDWGYAPEYVEGMWRMLQADEPDDFVLATGVGATVEQFAEAAFRVAGLDHRDHIEIDPSYYRPAEVSYLLGDPSKARTALGWEATTHWEELARIMVEADVQLVDDQLAGRQVRVDR